MMGSRKYQYSLLLPLFVANAAWALEDGRFPNPGTTIIGLEYALVS